MNAKYNRVNSEVNMLLHSGFTDRQLYILSCEFLERVISHQDDGCLKNVIAARRAWLRGEISDEEMAETWAVNWATAMVGDGDDVDWDDAKGGAVAAAWQACYCAAHYATRGIVGLIPQDVWECGWIAECEWQITRMLREKNKDDPTQSPN